MQASAQGNALPGPVLREEAEPAVLPALVRRGMGMCWAVSQRRGQSRQGAGEGSHSGRCWVLGVKRGGSNPNVIQVMGAPRGVRSQWARTLLPSPSSRSPAVKRDRGCWQCQARVRVLPVKGSVLNLGALPLPEGPGVVVCIRAGSGKGLLQPRLPGKRVAVSALLAVLEMLLHYFPWETHFCNVTGSVSGDVREG